MTARPVVDPVRLFCANFPYLFDLRGRYPTRRLHERRLPPAGLSTGEEISLTTYRNFLEWCDLVISGNGRHLHSWATVYAEREEPEVNFQLIARFLVGTSPPLLDAPLEEVQAAVAKSVLEWKRRALVAAGARDE